MTAERLGRRWKTFELSQEYVATSSFRFARNEEEAKTIYDCIMAGRNVDI